MTKIPAFIFDIDGVLADNSHRQHHLSGEKKDWNSFFSESPFDVPFSDTVALLRTIAISGYAILLVTGRSEDHERMTVEWLDSFGIPYSRLFQRRHLDFRKDYEVKKEIFETQIKDFFSICGVFEDRDDCVSMWRAFGLTCYQPRKAIY